VPPAGKGTTIFTGRLGESCARAETGIDETSASARASGVAHRLAQIEAWAWSMTKIASACVRIQRLSRKDW